MEICVCHWEIWFFPHTETFILVLHKVILLYHHTNLRCTTLVGFRTVLFYYIKTLVCAHSKRICSHMPVFLRHRALFRGPWPDNNVTWTQNTAVCHRTRFDFKVFLVCWEQRSTFGKTLLWSDVFSIGWRFWWPPSIGWIQSGIDRLSICVRLLSFSILDRLNTLWCVMASM